MLSQPAQNLPTLTNTIYNNTICKIKRKATTLSCSFLFLF
ncbi:hypothetical protein FEDK69T_24850 [Flavobacterium enshiense DK69]|nr:hypothetical protein FEDK69T_24850 [Flavobacterium enshiense DK69]